MAVHRTEAHTDEPAAAPGNPPSRDEGVHGPSVRPFRAGLRRLRTNRVALAFGGVFALVVVLCLLAPVYAHEIAHTGPNDQHITEVIRYGGHNHDVVSLTGIPIGPTWHSRFLLGADPQGRDLAVRLLYGGRTSLEIGAIATAITMVLATLIGLVAGYYRGWVDTIISRTLDIIWAFPALLLGVALGVSLALGGISVGPIHIAGGSIYVPALVIGVVYIPYVARPIRGEVLLLREREFIDAARAAGFGGPRIMFGEIFPNIANTLLVFVALQLAQSIILEALLSFLGAGVQAPNASWGTLLSSGVPYFDATPSLVLVPGIMLIVTCVSINVFGDGLRRAFDPKARIRVER